jgi:hypothetical protein
MGSEGVCVCVCKSVTQRERYVGLSFALSMCVRE